jgi:hypothetical protein
MLSNRALSNDGNICDEDEYDVSPRHGPTRNAESFMYSRRRNTKFGQLTTKERVPRELGDELGKLRTSDFSCFHAGQSEPVKPLRKVEGSTRG